jgi:hypothetical protein
VVWCVDNAPHYLVGTRGGLQTKIRSGKEARRGFDSHLGGVWMRPLMVISLRYVGISEVGLFMYDDKHVERIFRLRWGSFPKRSMQKWLSSTFAFMQPTPIDFKFEI